MKIKRSWDEIGTWSFFYIFVSIGVSSRETFSMFIFTDSQYLFLDCTCVCSQQSQRQPENLGCDGDTRDGYSGVSLAPICLEAGNLAVRGELSQSRWSQRMQCQKFRPSTSNDKFTLCLQMSRKQEAFKFFGIKVVNPVKVYVTVLLDYDWMNIARWCIDLSVIVLESSICVGGLLAPNHLMRCFWLFLVNNRFHFSVIWPHATCFSLFEKF